MLAGPVALLVLRALAPEPIAAPEQVEPTVDLRWDAPPECGPSEELIARIEILLGRPLGQPGDPNLEVAGRVVVEGEGLVLVLEFHQPVARIRELRGRTCVELRDAAAVVLAVTVDPLVPLTEETEETEETDGTERTDAIAETEETEVEPPEPEPEPEPTPALDRAVQIEGSLRVAGGIHYGALPGVAGGPSLAVGLRWRVLRAELVGGFWSSRSARFEQAPEVGANVSFGWVAPRVCGVPATPRVSFPLCAGVEIGGMRGAGFGTPGARVRTLPWIAAEVGAAVSVGLPGPLALWLGVDGVVPLVRPGFTVAGLGELHRVPAFAVQALVGLEIRLVSGRATDSSATGQGNGA